jgi:hypothetical protein
LNNRVFAAIAPSSLVLPVVEMKLRAVLELGLLALALPSTASAAASWGFGEASITIQGKAAAATGKQPYGFLRL